MFNNHYMKQVKIIRDSLSLIKKPNGIEVSNEFLKEHGIKFDGINLIGVDTDNYFYLEFQTKDKEIDVTERTIRTK